MARQEFVATDPYTHFAEDEAETGDLVYRVTVEPHAAEGLRDLSIIVGDAVHNLRSSLDLVAWQLVEANGGRPGDTTAFPIWWSEAQFRGGGAGYLKGAHPDAIKTMRDLKPYKGGNAALWRLHRLDATDKHRLLLVVGATHAETLYGFSIGGRYFRVPIRPRSPTTLLENGAEVFRVPRIARNYFENQPDPEITLYVALREPDAPLGLNLRDTLNDLRRTTVDVIKSFAPFLG